VLKAYQAELSIHMFDAMAELCVEVDIDERALDRVRGPLQILGLPLDEISDKVAYIKHCCMYDIATETTALMAAIQSLIGPREEDVDDHIATFQGNVQRA
jgi:hypothetical protein